MITTLMLLFETLTHMIIVVSSLMIYNRTAELYWLSLQKGLKYFSNAFMIYTVCFTLRYLLRLAESYTTGAMLLVLLFFVIYTASLGGFYLAYSLVWRRFEKDDMRFSRLVPAHVAALLIAGIDLFRAAVFDAEVPFVFYITMIATMLLAIHDSMRSSWKKTRKSQPISPYFLSTIGLAIGLYVIMFIWDLTNSIFPKIYFFTWSITTIVFITLAYNVRELAKGSR